MNKKKKKQLRKGKRRLRLDRLLVVLLGVMSAVLVIVMALFLIIDHITKGTSDVTVMREDNGKVVVIDPGHGGHDTGGSVDGVYEKDITLQISLQLGEILATRGYRVVYTRADDRALADDEIADLNARIAVAEASNSDMMISLHTNLIEEDLNERIYGYEIYARETDTQSMALADLVEQQLSALDYTQSRGVRNGDHLHLVGLNDKAVILVELGYLDDSDDCFYLVSAKGQRDIALALADALDVYFGFN